jgi:hypothetical protein
VGVCGAGFPLRFEDYRQNARECLRVANSTSDPRSKAVLIDMAVPWRNLADKVESIRHRPYAHHLALIFGRKTAQPIAYYDDAANSLSLIHG